MQTTRRTRSGSSAQKSGLSTLLEATALGLGAWALFRALGWPKKYDFAGKVVLITGGSRGLGLVLARELAAKGAHLVICARDQEELDRAFDDLASRNARVLAIPCDVSNAGQVRAMVAAILSRWGRIDAVINNAGIISVGPIETMTADDYREAMEVNFWGPLNTTLAVLPDMRRRREGLIVNVSSIGGKVSVPHLIPYNASKFALVGLSEGLRAELAKDGIQVTTICPGLMRTGSPRNASFKGQHQAEYAWFKISDSLPLLTISAERAARLIVSACERGAGEVVLSLPAKIAVLLHDLFPGWTTDILSFINRLLPGPGGIGQAQVKGKESESALASSWLTALSDRAALRNNEFKPGEWKGRGRFNGHHSHPDGKEKDS